MSIPQNDVSLLLAELSEALHKWHQELNFAAPSNTSERYVDFRTNLARVRVMTGRQTMVMDNISKTLSQMVKQLLPKSEGTMKSEETTTKLETHSGMKSEDTQLKTEKKGGTSIQQARTSNEQARTSKQTGGRRTKSSRGKKRTSSKRKMPKRHATVKML